MALPTMPGESHGRQQAREAIADMSRNVMDARGLYAVEWIGQPGYKCDGRGCQAIQVRAGVRPRSSAILVSAIVGGTMNPSSATATRMAIPPDISSNAIQSEAT